ncbi:glycosyltransferase family 2 protein [Pseudofrankia sp. BMG5.37]|nr:glycosyltransferase family 2 protein [Pseudofrankia sp. BMG5.37]MDT3441826.1 glycosyltransferase [Pseudofrankia sp. BMG5.37]
MLFLAGCWFVAVAGFWLWWFNPLHVLTLPGFILNTAVLSYLSYLPAYFVLTVLRLRRVNPGLPIRDFRVAFVVTKAPSEPWEMVRKTLGGMLAQDYPHAYDVWICDEDPTDETYSWCERHGVGISTRRGFDDYHRGEWPRRTKCKEGNLSFFYDHWGYDYYDVVSQLDADHAPARDYLRHMVRPFADPTIGYVAAPSICDTNARESWAARGRLYRESHLHGPVQAGASSWLAPACIGSHYAVRTAAIRDIGGIGPELAEDFSTTFLLCSAGWGGAFALDAEAHGDGPTTFTAAMTQEFQWSRSLMVLFMDIFPSNVPKLPLVLRIRFLIALSYYPLLALATAGATLLPPVAAITGATWVDIDYLRYLLLWCSAPGVVVIINLHLRRRGLLRPADAKLLAWETWLFLMARWPYVGWGCIAAVIQKIRPRQVTFKITPKGDHGVEMLPTYLVMPYAVIAAFTFSAGLYGARAGHPLGYVGLSLLSGLNYLLVLLCVCLMHAVETRRVTSASARNLVATVARPLLIIVPLTVLGVFAMVTMLTLIQGARINIVDNIVDLLKMVQV